MSVCKDYVPGLEDFFCYLISLFDHLCFLCMLTLGVSTLMKSAFQFNVIFVIASMFYSQGRSNLDFFMS